MIKVSVIVPCYNAANKIAACLRSLDEQTLPADQFEVIFIDDCSKDNAFELMHVEVAKRKNWYLFQTDANSGSASRPRNVGLDVAVGNYVFFLDCDDSLFTDTLESYLSFAEQNNADLVRGYLIADDGHTRKAMNRIEGFNHIGTRDERLVKIISSQSTTVPQLIRASILRQNSIQWPEHIRMGEDTIFLIDCLMACQEIAYIDHPTFIYNKSKNGEESVTQKYGARELKNHLTVWTEAEERLNRIGLSYLSIRLRIGLQSALLALIKFYTHDISIELFIKFADFINQHQKLISSFTYNERLKSILDTLYLRNYNEFNLMIQPRLVVAGYDLKFIQAALPDLSQYFQIEVDEWTGHNAHDEARSRKLLAWADIIFCEWLLGNAVWYAKHKRAEQKLFVRVHRFELTTPWCKKIDHSKVDSFFAVSLYFFEKAIERIGCPRSKMMLLPNFIDVNGYEQSDDPERVFRLAMIGILPSRKGFKQGLEILNELVKVDRRYTLEIAGKRPEDLPWIAKDPVEMAYFDDCRQFIEQNGLEQHVIFSGWQDIKKTAKNFGFVLSTSKSEEIPESFHIAPADGFCAGAIGLMLNWNGVEYIYPIEYIKRDVNEICSTILKNSSKSKLDSISLSDAGRKFIEDRYLKKTVVNKIVSLMGVDLLMTDIVFNNGRLPEKSNEFFEVFNAPGLIEIGGVDSSDCDVLVNGNYVTDKPNWLNKNQFSINEMDSVRIVAPTKATISIATRPKYTAIPFGSCFVHDLLVLNAHPYHSGYSRTSLMCLLADKIDINFVSNEFYYRQLKKSLQQSFIDDLQLNRYDFLIIDLIEERLDVIETQEGYFVTLPRETIVDLPFVALKKYSFSNPERLEKVCAALQLLYDKCQSDNVSPVIVNPFPATGYLHKSGCWVDLVNLDCPIGFIEVLDFYIKKATEIGFLIISPPQHLVNKSTIYHRWSPSEWHYETGVYYYINNELNKIYESSSALDKF